ncbi:MAG: MBOAT family protein [Candidatus Diapherotrites archaeon]|nr:MBOAT family protein [Candidatus Diapherotrites archaeon]
MLFNSFQFAVFLAAVLLGVHLLRNRKSQFIFLAAAGYFFYFVDSGFLFVLLLFSTLLSFFCGKKIFEAKGAGSKRLFLALGVAGNLLVLGFFKYANFALDSANRLSAFLGVPAAFPLLSIALPVGISFFTFLAISYDFDVFRGKLKPASFLDFLLYISFFPALLAGPITRATDFLPQLKKPIGLRWPEIKLGLTLIAWGIVKKVVFADNIAPFVNAVFADPTGYSSVPIMLATLAFGVQLYCDFSGYTDIAVGCARLLGLRLAKNFDKPYFAKSPSEFWRKWHISLSSWVRDYIYIPLGGSRKGKIRTYANQLAAMALMGLWHGAAWNFVLWGFFHGALLAMHKFLSGFRVFPSSILRFLKSLPGKVFCLLLTQYLVFFGWLLFRVRGFSSLAYAAQKFVLFDFVFNAKTLGLLEANSLALFLIAAFAFIHALSYLKKDTIEWIYSFRFRYWIAFIVLAVFSLIIFMPAFNSQFIYFQF